MLCSPWRCHRPSQRRDIAPRPPQARHHPHSLGVATQHSGREKCNVTEVQLIRLFETANFPTRCVQRHGRRCMAGQPAPTAHQWTCKGQHKYKRRPTLLSVSSPLLQLSDLPLSFGCVRLELCGFPNSDTRFAIQQALLKDEVLRPNCPFGGGDNCNIPRRPP